MYLLIVIKVSHIDFKSLVFYSNDIRTPQVYIMGMI